jgi:hypothetical protein
MTKRNKTILVSLSTDEKKQIEDYCNKVGSKISPLARILLLEKTKKED